MSPTFTLKEGHTHRSHVLEKETFSKTLLQLKYTSKIQCFGGNPFTTVYDMVMWTTKSFVIQ